MRKACQWVKENIAAFGGDPERITVAGQSGGAAGTGALHASPLMKGIVQRVSIESGPIYWGFMQPEDRSVLEQRGVEFMKRIHCDSIEDLIMSKASHDDLMLCDENSLKFAAYRLREHHIALPFNPPYHAAISMGYDAETSNTALLHLVEFLEARMPTT